ncbi:MAG: hydroxymethylbilane synthase [Alphaproteobacteria bacterium]|nr:hydroxymethylbilane synthase [Alphaproteobacteria bacterium]
MTLKIGTRGSKLALVQADMVIDGLRRVHPGIDIERVIITTSGDWNPSSGETRLLEQAGGKGLFAREIEQALLSGAVDVGVHSLKDMPSFLPTGLALDHVLERADLRDAFISYTYSSLGDMPAGAVIGTSSLRRQALILSRRPDLRVVPLRGNVDTRLQKLKDGQVDATYLAMAGLSRLGITGDMIHPIDTHDMLPACAQGIVGLETRSDDAQTRAYLAPLHHAVTGLCAAAERAVLQVLDGSCHTPIGAMACITDGVMILEALVASPDGGTIYRDKSETRPEHVQSARAAGTALGQRLKDKLPPGFLA